MANIGQKDGVYHVRLHGKEFKKSLKTRDANAARAAGHLVELTLHRIHTGQLELPVDADPGDFVVAGGTLRHQGVQVPPAALPSTRELVSDYLASQKNLLAPTYLASQTTHLTNLLAALVDRSDKPCDAVRFADLDSYLTERLKVRHPNTVERERISLLQFYKWVVRQGHLEASPAAGLQPIKGGDDRPPFRTLDEVARIVDRGGLTPAAALDLWECLYLSPAEIAGLLALVRENARVDYAYLLHAIPAYTGMRRGEVLKLRWLDVDLDDGLVSARSRKQSRRKRETARRIELHPELRQELVAWRESRPAGQFVVCEPDGTGPVDKDRANRVFWQPMRYTPWCLDNTRDRFKVGFHTYRHSFASNLAAAGVDQRVIDEMMGHTTEAMRRRYRHLFPSAKRAAIASFTLRPTPASGESAAG